MKHEVPKGAKSGQPLSYDFHPRRKPKDPPIRPPNVPLSSSRTNPWTRSEASLGRGINTDLLVIDAAEYDPSETDNTPMTLYCSRSGPKENLARTTNQLYWLHIQYTHDLAGDLTRLIKSCHLISDDQKLLAINLLERISPDHIHKSGQGRSTWRETDDGVLRVDASYSDDLATPHSVTFASTPYLIYNTPPTKGGADRMRSLLSFQNGYDVGEQEAYTQVLSTDGPDARKRIINVAHVGSFLIGSNVLITWSEVPRLVLMRDTIAMDDGEPQLPVLIRVKDFYRKESHLNIKRSTSLAELIILITNATGSEEFDIFLAPPSNTTVTADKWARILDQALIDRQEIQLALRPRARYSNPTINSLPTDGDVIERPSHHQDDRTTNVLFSQGEGSHLATFEESERTSRRLSPQRDGKLGRKRSATSQVPVQRSGVKSEDDDAVVIDIHDEEQRHARAMGQLDGASPSLGDRGPEVIDFLPGSIVMPFLMLGVSETRTDEEEKQHDAGQRVRVLVRLARLLRQVDESLREHSSYRPVGRSSLKDLDASQRIILRSLRRMDGSPIESHQADQTSPDPHEKPNQADDATRKSVTEEPRKMQKAEGSISRNVARLSCDILNRSKSLLGLFVPPSDTDTSEIPFALNLFWGALDLILKQLFYATMTDSLSPDNLSQTWVIRDSCQELLGAGYGGQNGHCEDCDSRKEYTFRDALKHIHTTRPDIVHDTPSWPCEDRCAIWLEPTKAPRPNDRLSILMIDLRRFRDDLDTITARATHLHQLFHRRQEPMKAKNAMNSTVKGLHSRVGDHDHSPPRNAITGSNAEVPKHPETEAQPNQAGLPKSILRAFELIISLFMIKSKVYHAMIRGDEDPEFVHSLTRIPNWKHTRYGVALKGALKALHSARGDLILSLTERHTGTVRLGAVGTECLAALCMMNLQRGVLTMPPQKRTGKLEKYESLHHEQTRLAGNPVLKIPDDIIPRYAAHLAELELKTRLKPQRKVFLEIRALENELTAVRGIYSTQLFNAQNLMDVIDPKSFRVTNGFRRARFPLEQDAMLPGMSALYTSSEQITCLILRTQILKIVLKESIEILEEGHGKAIRVFTLVTLFFLPLSFVSSFFGMNTSDVRDIPSGQWLYWATALPVTSVVLVLACLYAYRWESIESPFSGRWPRSLACERIS